MAEHKRLRHGTLLIRHQESPLPPRLVKRARESDLAFRAIQQRDALAAENAALEGENRRAWALVRRYQTEGGA